MKKILKPKNKSAFTLIELSIVLVIIGLIIGGITTGSSLIKQAQVKAVINEINIFKTAINTFRIQFNNLPGDMNNATAFWYNATTCPGTTGVAGSCNGNGNGFIDSSGNTTSDEAVRAWQHLSLATILPGSYSGIRATSWQNVPGGNVPTSKYPNGFYNFYMGLVTNGAAANTLLLYPTILPVEAYNIDGKLDDGLPITGKVIAEWTGNSSSAQCGNSTLNTYNLALTTSLNFCHLQFILD
jgi:prepilin-type N-terminal cleavage/methylation domain-containing protein